MVNSSLLEMRSNSLSVSSSSARVILTNYIGQLLYKSNQFPVTIHTQILHVASQGSEHAGGTGRSTSRFLRLH